MSLAAAVRDDKGRGAKIQLDLYAQNCSPHASCCVYLYIYLCSLHRSLLLVAVISSTVPNQSPYRCTNRPDPIFTGCTAIFAAAQKHATSYTSETKNHIEPNNRFGLPSLTLCCLNLTDSNASQSFSKPRRASRKIRRGNARNTQKIFAQ